MDSLISAIAVLMLFIATFTLLGHASARLGLDARPPEPSREWWERGW
jgi:hypothetical protein